MSTKTLFGKTLDARPDRLDIRDLPYRAPLKSLPEQYPSQELIDECLPSYRKTKMVLDQRAQGSCTGFGLAAVINYLRWEPWYVASKGEGKAPLKVSKRMLYQNARLYDEWKGEDYEGSSCRGAIKGFHRHGVCQDSLWPYKSRPGRPKEGWRDDAARTPLGAYYRIQTGNILEMQAAIFEAHAVYVSCRVHTGWRGLENCKDLDEATIRTSGGESGRHAFAFVGYTPDGLILQNSWGPSWGYHGFALLPYGDWVDHASDAWVLALGAPIRKIASPVTFTDISLKERAEHEAPGARAERTAARGTRVASGRSVTPWAGDEEADHVVFIGQGGRADREAVAATDAADAVRLVAEQAANSGKTVAIYCHGGLNDREAGLTRARILGPWFEANNIHPIFVVWQTGFFETAKNILDASPRAVTGAELARAKGPVLERIREEMDRGFEVSARNFGVKAIWDDMKDRAQRASARGGGMALLAKSLSDTGVSDVHLLGHSAGAILLGAFLGAMRNKLAPQTVHLWAPACTVGFASKTYGKAFDSMLDPAKTYISLLADTNETEDACIPLLYSKSLLYLVSRALESEHKTPVLGLEKIGPEFSSEWKVIFNKRHQNELQRWQEFSGAINVDLIVEEHVPTKSNGKTPDTIPADHGSFDNNLNVVNRALERILGSKPLAPVTDLRGF
jgi:hypothetical protein